jgi:hypothetical protein
MPVPGSPTVAFVPCLLMFVVKPRPPRERLVPLLLKFSRTPGTIFIDLRKRKPMQVHNKPG